MSVFLWSPPIRLCVKAAQLSLFLKTLCSMLKHRGTALSVNKQADRLTLHPQPLSCTEALALLLCWASLSHNTALLTQIHTLSEKHKVKELLGECPCIVVVFLPMGWMTTAALVGHNALNDKCQKSCSSLSDMWVFKLTGDNEAKSHIFTCTVTLNIPKHYQDELNMWTQMSKSVDQTLPCTLPSTSSV